MAALKYSRAALIEYLTIFRSRLGACNLVLPICSDRQQQTVIAERKLTKTLNKIVKLSTDDDRYEDFLNYIMEKNLVGIGKAKSAKYPKFYIKSKSELKILSSDGEPAKAVDVYETDAYLSSQFVRSTNGAPTPKSAIEILELTKQLGLISSTRNTITEAGKLISALRNHMVTQNPKKWLCRRKILLYQKSKR